MTGSFFRTGDIHFGIKLEYLSENFFRFIRLFIKLMCFIGELEPISEKRKFRLVEVESIEVLVPNNSLFSLGLGVFFIFPQRSGVADFLQVLKLSIGVFRDYTSTLIS